MVSPSIVARHRTALFSFCVIYAPINIIEWVLVRAEYDSAAKVTAPVQVTIENLLSLCNMRYLVIPETIICALRRFRRGKVMNHKTRITVYVAFDAIDANSMHG